jgi:tellurite resistance protein
MSLSEDLEILNAVLALAVVDGKLSESEKGVFQGLAARIGVGEVSLNAMIERAKHDPEVYRDLHITPPAKARQVMELLVAQARADGEISDSERELLVKISQKFQIGPDEFGRIYATGVARADELRRRRTGP